MKFKEIRIRFKVALVTLLLAAGAVSSLVGAAAQSANDAGDSNHLYHSLINWQFEDPEGLTIIVVPSVYFSQDGVLGDTAWITGGDPVMDYPGVAAVLEAIDYWQWMLSQYTSDWPVLNLISWDVRVVGVDAMPQDIASADIVVVSWMAHGPAPASFHLGVGLPVPFPPPSTQDYCVAYNSGAGWHNDVPTTRLRNLAVHEFGHCISAGHTYDTDGSTRLTAENDVMAAVNGDGRQCLSNLNVKSVAEGYRFLVDPGSNPGSGQTTIPVELYHQQCVPEALKRF